MERPGRFHRLADRVGAAGAARGRRAGRRSGRARGALAGADATGRRQLGRASVHRDRLSPRLLPELPPVPAGLPSFSARAICKGLTTMTETIPQARPVADDIPGTASKSSAGLLVLAPMLLEANAVRRGLTRPTSQVQRAGVGQSRASKLAIDSLDVALGAPVMVMGTAASLDDDLSPGDLVVATEVTDGRETIRLPGAILLAAELRRAGLRARSGKLVTVSHLVKSAERAKLAAGGAIAADMESLTLVQAAAGRPVAVIRAVSDAGFGPGIVSGGLAALKSLRQAAPVAEKWAAACADRSILLAGPRSFCAGVERAIEIVERALELRGAPVYVRKEIVHNKRVVLDLEQRGAVFVDELDEVPAGATVVFSAHGVSPAVRTDAAGRGLSVIDAPCPLVSKVHAEARRFAREGYTLALIGHAGHE